MMRAVTISAMLMVLSGCGWTLSVVPRPDGGADVGVEIPPPEPKVEDAK